MRDNSKLLIGLLIGAAAGAAIGILLTSDKGKEVLDELKDVASRLEEEVQATVEKGKEMASAFEEKLKQFTT